MEQLPPKFFSRLFELLCNPDYFEELQGDLEERYYRDLTQSGSKKARSNYRKQVIKMLRPSVIKRPLKTQNPVMLSLFNMNIKLTMRNLVRHKVFSAVNVFGLAAALSVSLFLVNLIHTGFMLDRQHEDYSRLYRIETIFSERKGADFKRIATIPYPVTAQLKEGLPDIESVCQISKNASAQFNINGESVSVFGIATEPIFSEMFNFEVVHGNMADVYSDLNSIAITEDVSKRFFQGDYPIGKITEDEKVVRAVIKSPKGNSHLHFEMVTLLAKRPALEQNENTPFDLSWGEFYSNYAYVKLNEQTNIATFKQRLLAFSARMNDLSGLDETQFDFRAKAVKMLTFEDPVMNEVGVVVGPEGYLTFTVFIAILIFLACFNYTNLSIARALQRTKEIGIRKTSGSSNFQIISQILVETLVFSLLGLVLGIGIYRYFSDDFLANVPFLDGVFNPNLDLNIILTFVGFTMLTGLIAGLFPALHFSRVNPLHLFNPRLKSKKISLMWVRKALTTFQLTLSMFCFLFVIMLTKQANLIKTAPQGFVTENVLILRTTAQNGSLLKPLVDKIPNVKSSSMMSNIPGHSMGPTMAFFNFEFGDSSKSVSYFYADENFDEVLEPKLLSGRFFSDGVASKTNSEILVNQEFLKTMNIEFSDALGHDLKTANGFLTIVGVLNDIATGNPFNHQPQPMMIIGAQDKSRQSIMLLKMNAQGKEETINQLEKAWLEITPDTRFNPEYLSFHLEAPVKDFINLVKVQGFVAFVIIAISLLGQLGISLYQAETRVKEIGIRKVLGAKVRSIMGLLIKGAVIPLLIATAISSPIAYLLFQDGIASTIRVPLPIGPGIFLQGLLMLGTLVLGIVVSQTWKIAKLNPADSLRSE